jgi:hypothetical protein
MRWGELRSLEVWRYQGGGLAEDGVRVVTSRWLAAAVLLAGVAGCADEAEAVPAEIPVPGVVSAPAAEHAVVAELTGRHARRDRFVARVRAAYPGMTVDQRDEEIVAIADQACTALADDADSVIIVARTRELGAPDDVTARNLVRMAIEVVCPDQDRHLGDF